MRFAHDSYNSNATGSSDWFGFEERCEFVPVIVRESTDDVDQLGCLWHFIFLGDLVDQSVQHYFLSLLVSLNETGNDLSNILHMHDIFIYFLSLLLVGFASWFIKIGRAHV